MYTESERAGLLQRVAGFMGQRTEFEGLLLIGSGAEGYADIYSDTDMMAGCYDADGVKKAETVLVDFLESLGAVYIDRRRWAEDVLGLSVYFENGLSMDISFMPTEKLVLRSPRSKLLFCKSDNFRTKASAEVSAAMPDDSLHHGFVYALRRSEIASKRGEMIYAEMALAEARLMLLRLEAAREGKDTHQFKAFNSLERGFLERLKLTYPSSMDAEGTKKAREQLLEMYLETVDACDFLKFDETQLKLLGCFDT